MEARMEIEEIRRMVAARLSEKRARHTLSVAKLAGELADLFGEDAAKAELAGTLHDCAKHMAIEEQLAFARDNGVALTDDDLASPGVVHAKIGAFLARREFGVGDEAVISAVRTHSTGRAGMSRLEKIVMAADYLEPNRPWEFRAAMLDCVRGDLEKGVLEMIRHRLLDVIGKGKPVHPASVAFYNWQRGQIRERER
jgi:predicted HD superfamily hydrolase involved in NAD metabolism